MSVDLPHSPRPAVQIPDTYAVGVLTGSLRRDSVTRKLARVVRELAPPCLELSSIEIGDLPLYNEDLDSEINDTADPRWERFRRQIRELDAVVFVTPEYNRSVPAPLKNAVDVGSAPDDQNAWDGKPAAIISVSPGRMGAFGANHHLRQSLVFLNMPTMQQPEAYIGGSYTIFDEHGGLRDPRLAEFLAGFMCAFAAWIDIHRPAAA